MQQVPPFVCDLSEEDQKEFWKYMVDTFVMEKKDPFQSLIDKARIYNKELESKLDDIKLKYKMRNKSADYMISLVKRGKYPFSADDADRLLDYNSSKITRLNIYSDSILCDTLAPDEKIRFTVHGLGHATAREVGIITVKYSHFKKWYPNVKLIKFDENYAGGNFSLDVLVD